MRKALRRILKRRGLSAEHSKRGDAVPEAISGDLQTGAKAQLSIKVSEVKKEKPGVHDSMPGSNGKMNSVQRPGHLELPSAPDVDVDHGRPGNIQASTGVQNASPQDKAIIALNLASDEFTVNYKKYQDKHKEFLSLEGDIDRAIVSADSGTEIFLSATLFKGQISKVLEVAARKAELSKAKWPNRVGAFLGSLYPVMRIAIGIASSAAEVRPSFPKPDLLGSRIYSYEDCRYRNLLDTTSKTYFLSLD